jgi:DNA-binding MarR family transcriptional regulator
MMPIVRVSHNRSNPYVMISRQLLCDPDLSLQERGLLAVLMSKPDKWQVWAQQLSKELNLHRNTVARLLEKLIKRGYCTRTASRAEHGRFDGYEYTVYEFHRAQKSDTVKS